MDNQHKKITGYRELSQEEIDGMNRIKEKAEEVREIIEEMENIEGIDHRWLAIGKTDLQKGFMGITRAIAKPDTF